MTIMHTGKETVQPFRRRPAKTATKSRSSRAVFGEEANKILGIPQFIDQYSHFMNGVDTADQLRSYYAIQVSAFASKPGLTSWKPQ